MKTEILAFIEGLQCKYKKPAMLSTSNFNDDMEELKNFIEKQVKPIYCDDADVISYNAEMARRYNEAYGKSDKANNLR